MKENYYIDPEQLSCEIVESQNCLSCTEGLAVMLMEIADKVLQFPSFRRYSNEIKAELKSYSLERFMRRGIYTVNPKKNPFAYITSAHSFNFIHWLKKHYQQENERRQFTKELLEQFKSECNMQSGTVNSALEYLNNYTIGDCYE